AEDVAAVVEGDASAVDRAALSQLDVRGAVQRDAVAGGERDAEGRRSGDRLRQQSGVREGGSGGQVGAPVGRERRPVLQVPGAAVDDLAPLVDGQRGGRLVVDGAAVGQREAADDLRRQAGDVGDAVRGGDGDGSEAAGVAVEHPAGPVERVADGERLRALDRAVALRQRGDGQRRVDEERAAGDFQVAAVDGGAGVEAGAVAGDLEKGAGGGGVDQ